MVVSLKRMLKSYAESSKIDLDNLQQDPSSDQARQNSDAEQDNNLPPIHYPSDLQVADNHNSNRSQTASTDLSANLNSNTNTINNSTANTIDDNTTENQKNERSNQQLRAKRVVDAVAQVNNHQSPTPLTDQYLAYKKHFRHPNRPPFDAATLWWIKHGNLPIMTELIEVVDEATLSAMPIEAVAILDRINSKLKRYREWTIELHGEQEEWVCERQYVIDKLIEESIPEAISHYEQLQKFSPHRTKNNKVEDNMTAADLLTDLFLEIDYELDELLDELHEIVINRLATTRRYVKNRTQN